MTAMPETTDSRRQSFAALRWDAAWIDPAIRRMAEAAAGQSGLSIEAWLERAIRKACDMPPAAQPAEKRAASSVARNFSALLNGARKEAAHQPADQPPNASLVREPEPGLEPSPYIEPELEPLALTRPVDSPRSRQVHAAPSPVGPVRGRAVTLVWAAGIAAVLAIVSVAALRDPDLMGRGDTLASDDTPAPVRSAADSLPSPTDLDSAPPRAAPTGTNRTAAFAANPAPAVIALKQPLPEPAATVANTRTASAPLEPATPEPPAPLAQATATLTPAPSATGGEPQLATIAPTPNDASRSPAPAAPTQLASTATIAPPIASLSPIAPVPSKANQAETAADAKLAASLEPKAAAGDHVAEYRLGILFALGKGVPRDYERSAKLLQTAAESGLTEAEYDYGVLYDKGLGVPRDSGEAVHWYAKAAQKGHPPAALNLGYAYAEGLGVTRNLPEAARWFRRAADAGLVNAEFNLAYMYEQGAGVTKSVVDADAWYSVAAEKGDRGAQDALERIEATLSPRQATQAKARVKLIKRAIRIPR
jgi:TPR repeat protein